MEIELSRLIDALPADERRFQFIIDGLPAIVALFTPQGRIAYCNRRMLDYLDETFEHVKSKASAYNFHPDDRDAVLADWAAAVQAGEAFSRDARLQRADGVYRWHRTRVLPLRNAEGQIDLWYGLSIDIEDTKRAEATLAVEKRLLEQVAKGVPLNTVLDELSRAVEDLAPGCHCSVLTVDEAGERFAVGAGPSLPASYNAILDGKTIDPRYGPCSLAVVEKAPIITADLASDPRWTGSTWLPVMKQHGFASCWSMPILSGAGRALGVFAIYRGEPEGPTPAEQELIDRFTHIAGIAIERSLADAALKTTEAELSRANAYLTEAQRLSKTGSFTWDVLAEASIWSPEMYRIFELPRDAEGSPNVVRQVTHPDDLPILDALRGEITEVRDIDIELRLLTASGPKQVHIVAHRVDPIRPVFVGAVQDITEAKAAEHALRLGEAELRRANSLLTEAQAVSHTGSFTWDLLADEHNWSEEIYRIFGFEPDTRVTMPMIRAAIHPEDMANVERVIGGAAEGADFDLVFRVVTPDGDLRHAHVVGHRIAQIADRPVFLGAIQDVTEGKRSEEALNKARADLARVSRITALSALTASIAHEVNQPLAGIVTNASTCLRMLAADPPDLDGARATAQRTIRDGHRASDVIQRLRALFARKLPLMEPVDLNDAAREVLALSSSELQRRRVVVRTELAADLPVVSGDRVQLQQVILNLVLNAADAMNEVEDRPRELLIATAHGDPGRVTLSVRDAGVGIAPPERERLFDAFYTTKADGMGIGLSISRSIIQGHDGRLWAAANDGPGTTFSFAIPCGSARPLVADEPDAAVRPDHLLREA